LVGNIRIKIVYPEGCGIFYQTLMETFILVSILARVEYFLFQNKSINQEDLIKKI